MDSPNYGNLHLLIADDDFVWLEIAARFARMLGFKEVSTATNGQDALAQLETAEIDLLLCDISMMPVNGLDVLRAIRSLPDKRKARLPVIFLTTHAESNIVAQAAKLGVDAFLVKPPTLDSMRQKIETVFRMRQEVRW